MDMKPKPKLLVSLCAATFLGLSGSALAAGEIIAPVDGVIDIGGPGSGLLEQTFDQNGLTSTYDPGVTNFDAYLATNPQHTEIFIGSEWFSNEGTTSAQVTYDFGQMVTIDKLALWNEESSGIGLLDVFINGGHILSVVPTDNPLTLGTGAGTYGADVWSFAPVTTRFVTFAMSGCPQPDPGDYASCAIGEVAFRAAGESKGGIPEPAAWSLMIAGFGLAGAALRSRRRAIA
jgi:hypothetical protein